MTKMILNGTTILPIANYTRRTEKENNRLISYANINMQGADIYDALESLMDVPITDIKIEVDDVEVYHVGNQNARITSLNEYLDENELSSNLTITFSGDTTEEE